MATLNRTFSVKNGIDVANTIIVDSSRNLSNIVTANAVTVNANTYLTVAGLNLVDHTNNAYGQANAAYGQANAAYGAANNRVLKAGDTMTGNLIMSGATINTATANISTIITGNILTLSTSTGSNGNIILNANGTEVVRIANNGYVGINQGASLSAPFVVRHPGAVYGAVTKLRAGSDEIDFITGLGYATVQNYYNSQDVLRDFGFTPINDAGGGERFKILIGGEERLKLSNNGMLAVSSNSSTVTNATSNLHVFGNANITLGIVTGAGINAATVNATTINASTVLTNSGINVSAQAADAYAQANTARDTANDAYAQANTARGTANDAYAQANSNYQPAVTRLDVSNSGTSAYLFDQYGAAVNNPTLYIRGGETLAFNLNNAGHPFAIRVSSGGSNYNTGLTHVATNGAVATGSNAQGKVSGTLYWKVPYELIGNTYVYQCTAHAGMVGNIVIEPPMVVAYAQANTARDTANGAYAQANGAYAQANGAYAQANGAFAQANGAYAQANGAYAQANGAYAQANGAYSQANLKVASINVSGNGLAVSNTTTANNNEYTLSVNTASTSLRGTTLLIDSISSNDTGNAATANAVKTAYDFANTKLPLTGGTITGDLNIDGDLYVAGNTSYINVATFTVEDALIYLAANNNQSDVVDIGIVGGKNTSGTFSHTGLARHATDGIWYLFDNLADSGHQNNVIDVANTTYALLKANLYAQRLNVATGYANIAAPLTVTGNSTFANVVINQNANIVGNLTVTGTTNFANTSQFNAAVNMASTLNVTGNTSLTNVAVNGVLTISSSGEGLTVANANVTNLLTVSTLEITSNTVTTSSSGQVVLDKFPTAEYTSAKYFVQSKSGSDIHTTEIIIVQDATNVWITEYGSIQTGPTLGTFSADISSGDVRLLFNANNNVNTIRSVRYGIIP
jgi:hypothetical protein